MGFIDMTKVFFGRETMKVKCPRCGKKTNWEQNPFRPFCTERCKLIDLGKWMNGSYTIPGESLNGDKKDEEEKESLDS